MPWHPGPSFSGTTGIDLPHPLTWLLYLGKSGRNNQTIMPVTMTQKPGGLSRVKIRKLIHDLAIKGGFRVYIWPKLLQNTIAETRPWPTLNN